MAPDGRMRKSSKSAPNVDRRIGRTRRAIRSALLDLLHDVPLEHLSVRDIAERADVGYTTFYRHYEHKEAVLREIADDEVTRILQQYRPALKASGSYAACLALCRHVNQHRAIWRALTTGSAGVVTKSAFIVSSKKLSSSWQRQPSWLPAEIGIKLIVSVHLELLTWWLRDAPDEPEDRIAKILDRLIVSSVVSKR